MKFDEFLSYCVMMFLTIVIFSIYLGIKGTFNDYQVVLIGFSSVGGMMMSGLILQKYELKKKEAKG